MADIKVSTLGGKPMLYDRTIPEHYGKTGVPFNPFMNTEFAKQSDLCFAELVELLETGLNRKVTKILSGGVSRAGSGTSLHHKNRAFDLDALLFDDGSNWVATSFPKRPHIYLAIEAVLRRHFGTVLSFDYNKAHEDHFHFDNGTALGFKRHAKSHVIFIQNALVFVYQLKVGRDGVWGGETDGALDILLGRLGIGGISDKANFSRFLLAVANDALTLESSL